VTAFAFLPSTQNVFQFQPTLDGALYTASVPWNLSGQRYYLNLFALDGTRIFTLPLIGSRDAVGLEDITWANGIVTATTVDPHGYMMGKTIDLHVLGCLPTGYNGRVKALVTGLSEVQYQLTEDPGPFTQLGVIDWVVDLAAGYFEDSMLVFRSSNATFEVTP
jgi:hypothetical protein